MHESTTISFNTISHSSNISSLNQKDIARIMQTNHVLFIDCRPLKTFKQNCPSNVLYVGDNMSIIFNIESFIPQRGLTMVIIGTESQMELISSTLHTKGYDKIAGYLLDTDIIHFIKAEDQQALDFVPHEELILNYDDYRGLLVDVRNETYFQKNQLKHSINIPISNLKDHLHKIPKQHFYLYGENDEESTIVGSWLNLQGLYDFTIITGGFTVLRQTYLPKDKKSKVHIVAETI